MKLPGALLLVPLVLPGIACHSGPSEPAPSVEGDRIAAHVKYLASDELEGRAPGTRGEELATTYIAEQFKATGAQPAGPKGSYFQKVPLVGVSLLPESQLAWLGGKQRVPMAYLDDYAAITHRQQPEVELDAEAVYVGHGIHAREFEWNDYKDYDMRGKIAVLFTNEPRSDDPGFFGGKALTYYGRWTFKYEEALRQGALGVMIVHTDETAGYPWSVVRSSWGRQNPFVRLEEKEPALAVAGWVTSDVGKKILAATGKTMDELLAAADSRDFQPIPLGLRLQGRLRSEIAPVDTRNVLAIVEGSDPARKDEAVVYSAHWDHLGVGEAVEGDNIYNGAVDNATGCGVLIELARAFAALPEKPSRSIIFAAVGAEEGGLRGSEYYAYNPVVPAGKTAVVLNYDGLSPLGRSSDVTLLGYERTTLRSLIDQVATEFGLTLKPDPNPEQGYYYRSDHFSLAKVGVPGFSISEGVEYEGKPEGWGLERRQDYTAHRYHQPSDEFDPAWDFSGLEQIANLGFTIGLRVANLPDLPTWQPGDEFLAAREKSWGK